MDTSTLDTVANKSELKTKINMLELVVNRISLLAILRIAWLRKLWQDNGNKDGQSVNYHKTIDGILWNHDRPTLATTWVDQQEDLVELRSELERIEKMIIHDEQSFLSQLRIQLGLNLQEYDLLQICLAQAIKPELSRVYAYMQDHSGRGYVTDDLYRGLFGNHQGSALSSASALKLWNLIHVKEFVNSEPDMYVCDPHIVDRLMGKSDMDAVLLGVAHIQYSQPPLSNWPEEECFAFIDKTLKNNPSQRINICVSGFSGSGRKTFAARISERLNLPLMVLDVDRFSDEQWERVYIHAQRHAYLEGYALCWTGNWKDNWKWPQVISPFQIQFTICEHGEHWPIADGMIDHRIEIPPFTIEERRQLWQRFVPQSSSWTRQEQDAIIGRYQLTIGQLVDVAQQNISKTSEAIKLLNASSSQRFGKLAQYLECPFSWDDLILKEKLKNDLSDFIFEAREREQIWESHAARRLFPQGKGLMALFSGPSGTGKTMAAQVIAADLGLDLYRIDLSTIVSKYVGETSKNLEQILSKAGQINAVLLFDEADALFGKRTDVKDAHDRYANTDTNYLLQAIESYAGIAILATNKKANIDSGFLRRLRYVLEFSKPDVEQRKKLWMQILSELAGEPIHRQLEDTIARLSQLVNVTGAQIKFSILTALFLSRKQKTKIGISQLLAGLERELLKEGRTLGREVKRKLVKES